MQTQFILAKSATPAKAGRVFTISLKGVPRVDAKTKARLEAAARTPGSSRRDYPQVIADWPGSTASVDIETRMLGGPPTLQVTFTLSGANDKASYIIDKENWPQIRARVTSISGTKVWTFVYAGTYPEYIVQPKATTSATIGQTSK